MGTKEKVVGFSNIDAGSMKKRMTKKTMQENERRRRAREVITREKKRSKALCEF